MPDPLDTYDASSRYAQSVLERLTPEVMARPSACEGWDVRRTVNHLIGGQHYFALCARGLGMEQPEEVEPDFTAGDLVAQHAEAAEAVRQAFTPSALGQTLATFRGDIPGELLLSIAAMENTLHAWDAAAGAGIDAPIPDGLAEPVLGTVEAITAGGRGDDFGAPVEVGDDANLVQRLLARSGRAPR